MQQRQPAARVVLRKAHYYTLGSLTQRAPKSLDHDEGTSDHFCRLPSLCTSTSILIFILVLHAQKRAGCSTVALTGETRTLEGSDPGRARGQLTVRPSVPRAHGSARSRGARSPVSAHHRTKTGQDHMAPHGRLRPNNPPRVLPDRTYGACILEGSSRGVDQQKEYARR